MPDRTTGNASQRANHRIERRAERAVLDLQNARTAGHALQHRTVHADQIGAA